MNLYYIEYQVPDDDFYDNETFSQMVISNGVQDILDDLKKYGNTLTKLVKKVDNIQIIGGKNEN